ncbi:alkene reductase [Janthinobacterium sp. Mn2066]|uniref:oxidoreductase n=1 Tax=Janthinobacterium sp. Mn2066 TaxID=3395264 RepID=UPI003BD0B7EA
MSELSSQSPALFEPLELGALRLPNRIVMAPMSRLRVAADLSPGALTARYYAQRASAGLIISESIMVAPYGDGYPALPAIWTPQQQQGWSSVVAAVHAEQGRIVAQLSTIGKARYDTAGNLPFGWAMGNPLTPQDLQLSDIAAIVTAFATAAAAAKACGFDGIEIHNGNGFLLDRFLRPGSNARSDQYGGSLENRLRLTLEIVDAAVAVWGPGRVGIRLSPSAPVNGAADPEGLVTFGRLLEELDRRALAYIHLTRVSPEDRQQGAGDGIALSQLRRHFSGRIIAAGEFDREGAASALADMQVDAIAFGRPFIANPDLPRRLALGAALQPADPATFYSAGEHGYTDYPAVAV